VAVKVNSSEIALHSSEGTVEAILAGVASDDPQPAVEPKAPIDALRVELVGRSLRLLRAATILAERQPDEGEIAALVDEVSAAYKRPLPDLAKIGRQLYDWLGLIGDGALSRQLAEAGARTDKSVPLDRRLGRLLDAVSGPMVFVLDDFDPNLDLTGRLLPAAAAIVEALVVAIRTEASTSRVLVTCRQPLALDVAPGRLAHLDLDLPGPQDAAERSDRSCVGGRSS
jgi:hypothetical protein